MGGRPGKKLREWCRYEFGTAVGDLPGNCDLCVKHFKAQAESEYTFALNRAEATGAELPVLNNKLCTPCRQCPKHALFPDNFGLDPRNDLAVRLWQIAHRHDIRIGTFDGAYLQATVTMESVGRVLDEFRHLFPNWLARLSTLRKILIIDEVSTAVRAEREEAERQRMRAAMDAKRSHE